MESWRSKPKILIVDDVDTNRFILRDIITDMGYQPLLAEHGQQALDIMVHIRPQLIVTDIAMPKMDGLQLCEKLKKDPLTREIPVIFISAYDNPDDIVKGFAIGGEDYITKPFLHDVVKARVSLHLKLYETKKKLSDSNRMLHASLQEQLKQLQTEKKNVVYALARVAREITVYDEAYMDRVCYNCRMVSEALQLTDEFSSQISDAFIDTIEVAASLSNLGYLGIPSELRKKKAEHPQDLTAEETEILKQHTTIGGGIIQDIQELGVSNGFLEMAYHIATFHHEHYDGSGYPEGRKGEDIPISAQIVAAVHEFCKLTDAKNGQGLSAQEAREKLMADDARRYHPQLCQVISMIYRQLH